MSVPNALLICNLNVIITTDITVFLFKETVEEKNEHALNLAYY